MRKGTFRFPRWRQRGKAVIYECRNCGTTLTPLEVEDEYCRYCGPTEVVQYQVA